MKNFRCFIILLLTYTLIKESRQSCNVEQFVKHEFAPYRYVNTKYIHCELTPFTSDFHKQVDNLFKNQRIAWLEVNSTKSPEIAPGAFNTLESLPDLRINSASVRVIQPGAFDGLLNLKSLSLKNNQIVHVTGNCFNLTNLESLDLSFNSIVDIAEDSFVNLTSLETLYLQNNFIEKLPPFLFRNLTRVKTLNLSFNKLTNLDNNLFKDLAVLTELLLNNNNLNSFSGNLLVHNLQLQTLHVNNNNLQTLTDLVFFNTNSTLNASHNLIQTLTFTNSSSLTVLDLSANGLTVLKKEFFNNVAVKNLFLDQNYLGLNPIPNTIFSDLSTCRVLSLSNNQIRNLDLNMFKNNNMLIELDVSKNELTQTDLNLPTSLEKLKLGFNSFNSSLNLSSLTNLNSLDLNHNNLKTVTFHFFENLSELQILNLNNNKISKIDLGAFRNLKRINDLNLSNNNISNLELGVFVGLDTIYKLDLSHNRLNTLNEGVFHNLRYLRILNIGFNNISFFDVENILPHMTYLREINLAGNNWPCSFLTTAIKDFRSTRFLSGNDFNVTNVNGIACRNEPKPPSNAIDFQRNFNVISSKLNTNNSLLICIMVILILGLTLRYVPPYLNKRKLVSLNQESHQLL